MIQEMRDLLIELRKEADELAFAPDGVARGDVGQHRRLGRAEGIREAVTKIEKVFKDHDRSIDAIALNYDTKDTDKTKCRVKGCGGELFAITMGLRLCRKHYEGAYPELEAAKTAFRAFCAVLGRETK